MNKVAVIPLKNGCWRVVCVTESLDVVSGAVRLSPKTYALHNLAYRRWWVTKGNRLAVSPEMWQ